MDKRDALKIILEEIRDALRDVAQAHKCKQKECRLTFHPKGVLSIDVKRQPIFWFFHCEDLVNWLKAR